MKVFFLIGRVIAGAFYIQAGIHHFTSLAGMAGFAKGKGVPLPELAVAGAGVLLLIAGFSFLLGYKPLIGIAAAVLFFVPVTFMMHNFWAETGAAAISDKGNFLKNMALLGSALMFLMIRRPWPWGLGSRP